ncbi:MAG TPA: biosynthetic-type acetolactate synthase large subunit [Polyangia bacterium]|nr:biosynthetic-type acetolactate synthase large subunit [Polyangia bacterium]
MKRTGAQIVWEVLTAEGVEVVFGYPGGAIMPVYDAMLDYRIHHVLVRHEQGAAHMADGYARASGKVGVALATSGPGATNLVTGIATAMLDSSPMVCITGQVPSKLLGSDAFQETDITGVTLPITKHNFLVTAVEEIAPTLRQAFAIARSGRPGPVLVDITKDAQQASCEFEHEVLGDARAHISEALAQELERAAQMIDAAERPLLLVGQGVIQSGAAAAVRALAEKADIPVAATLLGLGAFPATHPLALGMMGMHGEAWVNHAIQEADLVVALGMRFDDRVTGDPKTFAARAKKIHVEIDGAEIGKTVRCDLPIVADLRTVAGRLVEGAREASHGAWRDRIAALRQGSAHRDILLREPDGKLHAAHVIDELWRATDGRALVVTDVGQHQMWEAQYYKHERPRSLVTSGGLGTMGFALPAAIGARFARRDEEIWVVVGDGGFQMTACELSTCAQEGLKLNIAVINNGYLGMVRQWQELFYDRRYAATPMQSPDFVKLAEAHGLSGLRCDEKCQVRETIEEARLRSGTVVVDFRVAAEENVYPMVPSGGDIGAMIRRPDAAKAKVA